MHQISPTHLFPTLSKAIADSATTKFVQYSTFAPKKSRMSSPYGPHYVDNQPIRPRLKRRFRRLGMIPELGHDFPNRGSYLECAGPLIVLQDG